MTDQHYFETALGLHFRALDQPQVTGHGFNYAIGVVGYSLGRRRRP
jgi:hypothetical protein